MNIFQPKTEAEVAQVIRETNRGLSIFGGGTRGVCERGGNSLETKGLSGIIDYQPGALTMIAQAGTPLKEIAAALDQEGQRLPFEPMDFQAMLALGGSPTIGGANRPKIGYSGQGSFIAAQGSACKILTTIAKTSQQWRATVAAIGDIDAVFIGNRRSCGCKDVTESQ